MKMRHILEHQAVIAAAAVQAGQGPPMPPQETPRMGPEVATPERAGMIPGLPVEAMR